MNKLYEEKLRNGMSADDLYNELMSDFKDAVKTVQEEKEAAAAAAQKLAQTNRDKLLHEARASLITALDKYAQVLGDNPLTEEQVSELERNIIELEEGIKSLLEATGGIEGLEDFVGFMTRMGGMPVATKESRTKLNKEPVVERCKRENDDAMAALREELRRSSFGKF